MLTCWMSSKTSACLCWNWWTLLRVCSRSASLVRARSSSLCSCLLRLSVCSRVACASGDSPSSTSRSPAEIAWATSSLEWAIWKSRHNYNYFSSPLQVLHIGIIETRFRLLYCFSMADVYLVDKFVDIVDLNTKGLDVSCGRFHRIKLLFQSW